MNQSMSMESSIQHTISIEFMSVELTMIIKPDKTLHLMKLINSFRRNTISIAIGILKQIPSNPIHQSLQLPKYSHINPST